MSQEVSGLNLKILSDEPSLSSASLCTKLHLVGHSFRPEYTHQCLPEETYRGYCPFESAIQEKKDSLSLNYPKKDANNVLLHKSHQRHSIVSQNLEVQIQLAPSCRQCRVLIHRTPTISVPACNAGTGTPLFKKPKLLEPMTDDEIRTSLTKALPTIVEDDDFQDDFLSEPVGTILMEYSCPPNRTNNGDQQDFVVSLAEGSKVAEYHSQVQRLALWFIENADDVDIADDQSGVWKVIYLFRKHSSHDSSSAEYKIKYSLVGYMTLFHFNAPFHKPKPGIIVRICQALVFPPYQKQGHGSKMMQCVYDLAHENKFEGIDYPTDGPKIVQINVEDPSSGFTFLRNTFDYRFLTRLDHQTSWWPASFLAWKLNSVGGGSATAEAASTSMEKQQQPQQQHQAAFTSVSDEEALQISTKAKILPRQVQIVNELVHLRWLLQQQQQQSGTKTTDQDDDDDDDLEKQFRLMVKKRLNREHREEMGAYPTKEEKKAYLAELYEEAVGPYKAWFQKRQMSKTFDSLDASCSNTFQKENAEP